jgi:hypothetical protein
MGMSASKSAFFLRHKWEFFHIRYLYAFKAFVHLQRCTEEESEICIYHLQLPRLCTNDMCVGTFKAYLHSDACNPLLVHSIRTRMRLFAPKV